jgi:hypothetical protein
MYLNAEFTSALKIEYARVDPNCARIDPLFFADWHVRRHTGKQ